MIKKVSTNPSFYNSYAISEEFPQFLSTAISISFQLDAFRGGKSAHRARWTNVSKTRVFKRPGWTHAYICVPRRARFSAAGCDFFFPSLSFFFINSRSLGLSIFGINCLEKRRPCEGPLPLPSKMSRWFFVRPIPTCPSPAVTPRIKYRQLHRDRPREIADTENTVSSRFSLLPFLPPPLQSRNSPGWGIERFN